MNRSAAGNPSAKPGYIRSQRTIFILLPMLCAGPLQAQKLLSSSNPASSDPPSFAVSAASMPQADSASGRFDSHAMQLLEHMAEAYSHLPSLNQRTVFYSATIPLRLSPDRRTYLPAVTATVPADPIDAAVSGVVDPKLHRDLFLKSQAPNRLRLEMREPDPDDSGSDRLSVWVSDGKTFWTYSQEKHIYTQEKAPSRMSGFQKMGHLNTGSLELMMMIGVNPFTGMQKQVDCIVYEGTHTVRGVATETVSLVSTTPGNVTRASFYIGCDDQLLHRLSVVTTPRVLTRPAAPGRVGDELDALMDSAAPPPSTSLQDAETRTNPILTRLTYDNLIAPSSQIDRTDFAFKIPLDASLYSPFDPKHLIGAAAIVKRGKVIDGRHASRRRVIRP